MVEKWNIGLEFQRISEFKNCMRNDHIKLDPIRSKPVFHHSIFPVPHCIGYVKTGMLNTASRTGIQ